MDASAPARRKVDAHVAAATARPPPPIKLEFIAEEKPSPLFGGPRRSRGGVSGKVSARRVSSEEDAASPLSSAARASSSAAARQCAGPDAGEFPTALASLVSDEATVSFDAFESNVLTPANASAATHTFTSDAGDAPDHPCAVDLPLNRAFVGVCPDVEEASAFRLEESAAESLGSMPASSSSARIAVVRIASSATAATRASVARRAA